MRRPVVAGIHQTVSVCAGQTLGMATASAQSGAPDLPAEQTHLGNWWIAGVDRQPVGGLLTFHPQHGASLKIAGSITGLLNRHVDGDPPLYAIFGVTADGEKITVLDAWLSGWSAPFALEAEATMETFRSPTIAIGSHLRDGSATLFGGGALRSQMLDEWAYGVVTKATGGFGRPHNISVEVPEPIEVDLPLGEVILHWPEGSSMSVQGETLKVDPYWAFKFSEHQTLDGVIRGTVRPLLELTGFATGAPDTASRIRAWHLPFPAADGLGGPETAVDGRLKDRPVSVTVHTTRVPAQENEKSGVHDFDFWLRFQSFTERPEVILQKWFDLQSADLSRLLVRFLSGAAGSSDDREDFGTCIRGLEQWCTQFVSADRMDEQLYRAELDKIEEVVSGDMWQLIKPIIRYSHGPTLAQQLKTFSKELDWPIGHIVESMPRFIAALVKYRGGYMHGFRGEPPFTDAEIVWALHVMRLLGIQAVLQQIGFTHDEAGEMLHQRRGGVQLLWDHDNPIRRFEDPITE